MPESLETPVLLVIFNRPDLTARAMEILRRIQPRRLFIAADGPRPGHPAERDLCEAARAATNCVDWPCDVVRNYAETNMGCGLRPATAISWAFETIERLIVMEDDCEPAHSAFWFCEELLERYAGDERIMHIGCTNFRVRDRRTADSYRFSKYPHGVFWATWRRAWGKYDYRIEAWPRYRASSEFKRRCFGKAEQAFWSYYWDSVHSGSLQSAWDYQWTFACWLHNGLAISPSVNLVTNTGFRSDGTHTKEDSPWANMPAFEIGEMVHPRRVEADRRADWWEFVHHYGGEWYREQTRPMNRLRRYLRPLRSAAKRLVRR